MARPKQDGLKYFSFDTDFFYADKRIKRLHARYGNNGVIFYIYLLTEIYRNGYYIRWDEDSIYDAMSLNLTEGFIEQVMLFFNARELIVKIDIEASNGTDAVITSPGIQKRYQEAVKSLKRDVYVDADIWLLKEEETATYIKITRNKAISKKNIDKSEKNENESEKKTTNEIKEKEINDISVTPEGALNEPKPTAYELYQPTAFELKCVDRLIQSILNDFPNQRVPKTENEIKKWAVHINRLQELDGMDEEKIWNTLVWTLQDSFWRTNIRSTGKFREKFQTLYLQSTRSRSTGKNNFNDFEQNDYDFNALEKELVNN